MMPAMGTVRNRRAPIRLGLEGGCMSRIRIGFVLAAFWTVLALPGCSDVEFGESVSLPQERHGSLLDGFAAGKPLELPSDTAFNLADSQRSSEGTGRAESSADPAGSAHCSASADGIGTGTAEFQLGHGVFQILGDPRGQ